MSAAPGRRRRTGLGVHHGVPKGAGLAKGGEDLFGLCEKGIRSRRRQGATRSAPDQRQRPVQAHQSLGVDRHGGYLNDLDGNRDVPTRDTVGEARPVPVLVDPGQVAQVVTVVPGPLAEYLAGLAHVLRRVQNPAAADQRSSQGQRSSQDRVGPAHVGKHEAEHLPLVGEVQQRRMLSHQQLVADHLCNLGGRRRTTDVLEQGEVVGPLHLGLVQPETSTELDRDQTGGQAGLQR